MSAACSFIIQAARVVFGWPPEPKPNIHSRLGYFDRYKQGTSNSGQNSETIPVEGKLADRVVLQVQIS
jgi:hypothetical protein